MKATDITTTDVSEAMFVNYRIRPRFEAFCDLVGACEECDRRVRFWCKVVCAIRNHQHKRIVKLCRENEERLMRTQIEHCPLCRHEAKVVRVGDQKNLFIVRCSNPDCMLEMAAMDESKAYEGDAIYLWNTRVKRFKDQEENDHD